MRLDQLENEAQATRWREILAHKIGVEDAYGAQLHGLHGFLRLVIDSADADTWGIYPGLLISPDGQIAEDDGEHVSSFYPTFVELLTAAAARTATS